MDNFIERNPAERERPPFLYHGSRNRGVQELEPRRISVRNLSEGHQIFATPDLALAAIFMSGEGKHSGKFGEVPYVAIVGSREEFAAKDEGGHIHVLPSDKFSFDPDKGLRELEWTTSEKVKPIKTIEFSSALEAMIENGVQVYFIDKKTSVKIKNSSDHGLSILKGTRSENERRGLPSRLTEIS